MRFKGIKVNYLLLLLGVTLAMATLRTWYVIYQSFNLHSAPDTATFIQSLSSTLYSHLPFYNTILNGSFFSVHGSPILFVLLPFYAVMPGFISLYIILDIVNYFPSIPLFLMARKSLKSEKLAFIYGLSYVFYPFIYPFPFEVLTLFAGLFIFAFYFYTERKWIPFFIFFALSLSTIEFSPIIGAFFTFYLLADRAIKKKLIIRRNLRLMLKCYWLEISVFILSVSFFLLEIHMISFFSHATHSAFSNLYGTNPFSLKSITEGLSKDPLCKLEYIIVLNVPFLLLSFIDPMIILEIPWSLAVMISVFPPYWYDYVYYGSYIAPFAVLGFLKAVERIKNKVKPRDLKILLTFTLAVNILIWFLANGSIITYPVNAISPQDQGIFKLADMIPQGSSVYTGSNCLCILSSRTWNTWVCGNKSTTFVLFNSLNGPPINLSEYELYAAEGDFLLYKKDFNGTPLVNYYLNLSLGHTCSAIPYVASHSVFLPKGNYTVDVLIKGNGFYPKILDYNFANSTKYFELKGYLLQKFSVKCPITLGEIIIFGKFSLGQYNIVAKISTSLNNTMQTSSILHKWYCVNSYEIFKFNNLKLEPGKTYYLWIYVQGSPKCVYLQGTQCGKGLYYYSGSIINITGAIKFALIDSEESVPHLSNFTIRIGNSSYDLTIYKCSTLTTHLEVNSSSSVQISINSTEPYSYFVTTIFIHGNNYHELQSFIFQEPYEVLIISLIPSAVIMLASLKFREIRIPKISSITLLALLGIFYVTFSLNYFSLVNVNPIIFTLEGIAITVSLAILFFSSFGISNSRDEDHGV